jgi:dihydroorotate dehydrogenase
MIFILSYLYRCSRRILGFFVGRHDYETTIIWGHFLLKCVARVCPVCFTIRIPSGFEVQLHHLVFPSPIILSSFEGDPQMVYLWTQFGLGGATLKTLMPATREGNPRPRILRVVTPEGEGLLNAMGLPGKGWDYFLTHLDDYNHIPLKKPLGISVGGNSIDDYFWALTHIPPVLDAHPIWAKRQRYFELNISCPNTAEGQSMLAHPELLDGLLKRIRGLNNTDVIGIKLSPDQSNDELHVFARIINKYPLMYVALGNTQYRKCVDFGFASSAIVVGGGGVSGPALFARTLEMVMLFSDYSIPIMAIGGVSTSEHVRQLIGAGATMVACATSLVTNPYWVDSYYT